MPHISVSMYAGRTPEVKKALAEKIRETVSEELLIDRKAVSVSFCDVQKENWEEHMKQFPDRVKFDD